MLCLQNLSIRAGVKPLFDGANLNIHPGQKIGLVGQNGVGKTTLFKCLLGEVSIEAGNIGIPANWLIGYVEQEVRRPDAQALRYVTFGDTKYAEAQELIEKAEASNDHDLLVKAYDALDKMDGFAIPSKAKQLLYGLGFVESDFTKPMAQFSGGWQVRLKLGRALMQRSDLLLLDEPTNHLDIEAVAWLEQWLKSYQGAILIISHDRDFLDQAVQGIAHIHDQKITFYSGNFASFERQRNEQLMQQQSLHDKQKQQMQHLKSFIERFKAKASKAKQAQSRVKALERMESIAAVQATNPFHFEFIPPLHQPDPMLSLDSASFSYPQKPILDSVKLVLRAGDRIGLVGVNGSGKSTLIKLLVGDLKPSSGKVQINKGVKFGYFAQHQLESLILDKSPLQHLLMLPEAPTDQEARNFLGGFGFSNTQCLDSINHFSGGEKARLALAMIVFQKPNLIILDEPTNHLDMETRDALDMALQDFTGALIVVTHDKHLLTSIADQFWWVHNGEVSRFVGDLDTYLQARLKQLKQVDLESKETRPGQTKKQARQINATQRKKVDARLKPITQAVKKIERQLESLQAKQSEYHTLMEDSRLYEAENKTKLAECIQSQAECEGAIEECEMEWLELQERLEVEKEIVEAELTK
ncbi:ATP-binding cassette domain-containing protein [Thiomicrorhabdus arctica]|jgi:ATP-binding cassette subfamily F protein 3|uniref:ATP-binding cassette domain-containing protein n=1 Tax=Thiomicrorhabdus arctica TaxID=131540 RepID=UPI00037C671B|nr:ATP-binding cassette domain-containing protein [Thiomicrorhabdus arctica]